MKKLLAFIFIIAVSVLVVISTTNKRHQQRFDCATVLLSKDQNAGINIENRGKQNAPLITGMVADQKTKNRIIDHLKIQCEFDIIEDFIEVNSHQIPLEPWVNFTIDNVNNVIEVSGQIHRQSELQAIVDSFATSEKRVMQSVHIDKKIPDMTFAENITFLLSAIDNIQLADITIYADKIIVKGLVRDVIRKKQTLDKLKQLFADQFAIIDELETVVKNTAEIEALDIEFAPLPPPEFQQ